MKPVFIYRTKSANFDIKAGPNRGADINELAVLARHPCASRHQIKVDTEHAHRVNQLENLLYSG